MVRKAKIEYWGRIPDEVITVDPSTITITNGVISMTKFDELNGVPFKINFSMHTSKIKDITYLSDEELDLKKTHRMVIVFHDGSIYTHNDVDVESIDLCDGWLLLTTNDGEQMFGYPKDAILRYEVRSSSDNV